MQRFLNLVVFVFVVSLPVFAQIQDQGPSRETLFTWAKNAHMSEMAFTAKDAERKGNTRKNPGSRFINKQNALTTEGTEIQGPQTYTPGDKPLFILQTSTGVAQPTQEVQFHLVPIASTGGHQGSLFAIIWIYDPDGNATYDFPNLGQGLNGLNKVEAYGSLANVYTWRSRLTDRNGKYWFTILFFDNYGQLVQQVAADVYLGNIGGSYTGYPFVETAKLTSDSLGRSITLSGNVFGQLYVGIGSAIYSNTQTISVYQPNWGADAIFSCPGFGISNPTFMPVTVFMPATRTCYTYSNVLYK